jgi:hypothetical protein
VCVDVYVTQRNAVCRARNEKRNTRNKSRISHEDMDVHNDMGSSVSLSIAARGSRFRPGHVRICPRVELD